MRHDLFVCLFDKKDALMILQAVEKLQGFNIGKKEKFEHNGN